jgi:hypothetical protein
MSAAAASKDAKKKTAKKKKKDDKDEETLSLEEQNLYLTRQVEALKLTLGSLHCERHPCGATALSPVQSAASCDNLRPAHFTLVPVYYLPALLHAAAVKADNKSTIAECVVRELRSKLFDLQRDYEEEKQRTFALASDMTRQYKRKVEDMQREKSEEEQLRMAVEDKLAALQLSKAQMERSLQQALQLKDAEIVEQKAKMDQMAYEFGQMLKATLDKMSEKIEITNEWADAASGGANPVVRTFEEFHLGQGR